MGVGTKDEQVVPPPLRQDMTRKANPVVAGGVVRGTWARKGDDLTVSWRDRSARPDASIRHQAARLGATLGRELRLTIGS
jgi:hypothetical protein